MDNKDYVSKEKTILSEDKGDILIYSKKANCMILRNLNGNKEKALFQFATGWMKHGGWSKSGGW